jgi:hypothetical protein
LQDRNLGQHAVDEVGSGEEAKLPSSHAPSATRRTEPTTLAGEGDEPIVTAVVAVDAQESMSQDATFEIGADLALDEAGDGRTSRSCAPEEGLELVPNDLVEESLLGLVTFVAVDSEGSARTVNTRCGERSADCMRGRVESSGARAFTAARARDHGLDPEKFSKCHDDFGGFVAIGAEGTCLNPQSFRRKKWSRRSDSNRRPAHYEILGRLRKISRLRARPGRPRQATAMGGE